MRFERFTLANEVNIEGLGLHTGDPVSLRVIPGDQGIGFRHGSQRWKAEPSEVTDTSRATKLGDIAMVEHIMSALCGAGITDCEIEVSGGKELPALDGSARDYLAAIESGGSTLLGECVVTGLFARVFEKTEDLSVAISKGEGHWRFEFDLGDRWPGLQDFEYVFDKSAYRDQIASARTFALEEEMPMIEQMGLGKGLDASSAFVIGANGYLNEVRFSDEPVRHKLLDLLGDIYLAGIPAHLINVVAIRAGHRANVAAAAKLAATVKITSVESA